MMQQTKKIYFILLSLMLLFVCGCANNHTTYTYDNPKEATEIGWTTSDDGANYYTEEEKQKQKEAKEFR